MEFKTIHFNNFSGGMNNVIEPHLIEPTFCHELRNATVNNGAIKSAKGGVVIDAEDSELIYQTGNRSVIKWGGSYFWSDNVTGELNSTYGHLGLNEPTQKCRVTEEESSSGDRFAKGTKYKYFYTYKTSEGFRSGPSEISEITLKNDIRFIRVTDFDLNSMADVAVIIEVWRALGEGYDFYKSGECTRYNRHPDTGRVYYHDITSDEDIVFRENYDLTQPDGRPTSGKYLCERNSVFYIAQGDKVYFSKQSNPHSYPALNYITFDDEVTGMITTEDFTMVFTLNRAYVITGNSIADMAKEEIPDGQGVKNWRTISRVRNMPIWVSNDGVCAYQAYDNRSGRKITILSENVVKLPSLEAKSAVVANDVYYLFYDDETLAFDFINQMKVYYLDWRYDWGWNDKDRDRLVTKRNEVYYDASGGDPLKFTYKSLEFVDEDMNKIKQFGRIYLDADCDLTLTYFVDGVEVWTNIIKHNGVNQRTEFISPVVQGRRLQVQVSGKGYLRGFRIDYTLRRM